MQRATATRLVRGLALCIPVLVIAGCGWFPYRVARDAFDGSTQVFYYDLEGVNTKRPLRYAVTVGSTPRDVFLVFTNATNLSIVAPLVEVRSEVGVSEPAPSDLLTARGLASTTVGDRPPVIVDNPHVREWEPPPLESAGARSITPQEPSFAVSPPNDTNVNDVATFIASDGEVYVDVDATLVFERTVGGLELEIWVETSEYDPGPITYDMVVALADNFLKDGVDDIHTWVGEVFGRTWSDTASQLYGNLIPNQNNVTIFLHDIGGDGPGGIIGYFWSKDNFKSTGQGSVTTSNERVMFYLDSASYAAGEGTWDIDDFWPTVIVSTLAHELQHMIHFHERGILRGASSPTWLEELMSLAAEDLVEEKLGKTGPRGVDPAVYAGGEAGAANNSEGRLPDYNVANDISLSNWGSFSQQEILNSYSIAYAFGAYLGRNYGGARVFERMMQSSSSNPATVITTAAEQASGETGLTLAELLARWGASVLLSGSPTPVPYRLNPGQWIVSSTTGDYEYRLGSINHYNYRTGTGQPAGPYVHTDLGSVSTMPPASKLLYRVGSGLTGTVEIDLEVSEGTTFAVVVR